MLTARWSAPARRCSVEAGGDRGEVAPRDQAVHQRVGPLADGLLREAHAPEVGLVGRRLAQEVERAVGDPAGGGRVGLEHDELLDGEGHVGPQHLARPSRVARRDEDGQGAGRPLAGQALHGGTERGQDPPLLRDRALEAVEVGVEGAHRVGPVGAAEADHEAARVVALEVDVQGPDVLGREADDGDDAARDLDGPAWPPRPGGSGRATSSARPSARSWRTPSPRGRRPSPRSGPRPG